MSLLRTLNIMQFQLTHEIHLIHNELILKWRTKCRPSRASGT